MGECAVCRRPLPPGATRCDSCGGPAREKDCAWHPAAPSTATCLLCQRPLCERCRTGSEAAPLCPDHARLRVFSNHWVEVYSSAEEIQTHLLAEALKGEEIEARVLSQKDHVYVVGMGNLSVLRIIVPAHSYARAQAALAELGAAVSPPPSCPVCRTPYVEGEGLCSGCGLALTHR